MPPAGAHEAGETGVRSGTTTTEVDALAPRSLQCRIVTIGWR